MISFPKFTRLKAVTRYFRLAEELESLRNSMAEGGSPDISGIEVYFDYLTRSGETLFMKEISSLVSEKDRRLLFEKVHFLFHSIKDHFGYPVAESRFISSFGDGPVRNAVKGRAVVILENIRSAFNTGAIIRACDCFGAKELILAGLTPGTDNPKVTKTSKGAEASVIINRSEDISKTVSYLRNDGYIIAGAETGSGSADLRSFIMPERTAFIFGNEEIGITAGTLKMCDYIVSVRMYGVKNSMNAAGAVSVFLYEYSKNHLSL